MGALADRADKAGGVAVVEMDQRAVAIRQVADLVQPGDIAVHGKHAVGGDQFEARASGIRGLKLRFQVGHIVVAVAVAAGLAQAHSVDDAGVVELVGDDRVLLTQEGFEQAAVGVETGGVEDGVLGAQEVLIVSSSCLCRVWVPQIKRTEAIP